MGDILVTQMTVLEFKVQCLKRKIPRNGIHSLSDIAEEKILVYWKTMQNETEKKEKSTV